MKRSTFMKLNKVKLFHSLKRTIKIKIYKTNQKKKNYKMHNSKNYMFFNKNQIKKKKIY